MPVAIIAVIVVALIGAATYFFTVSPADSTPTDTETSRPGEVEVEATVDSEVSATAPTNTNPTGSQMNATVYRNGTYTATGGYLTPARTSHTVKLTITVENDIIIASSIQYDGKDGYSNPNQERFDNTYKEQVIGASLREIRLSRVGAASLTSQAFNDAIVDITEEARING
jgi:hypothetical protein